MWRSWRPRCGSRPRALCRLESVVYPRPLILSLACEFLRCEHLQGERVNLVAHRFSQGAIDQLMALHGSLAREHGRNHHGVEMHVVLALDARLAAGQTGFDDLRHLFWIHARSCKLP